jgi:hypothetical protein
MHHTAHVSVSAEEGRHESAGADYGSNGGEDLHSGHRRRASSTRCMRLDRLEVSVKMDNAELIIVMIFVVGTHGLRVVFSSCMRHDCKMSNKYGVREEDC